jgi:hypothetical protein
VTRYRWVTARKAEGFPITAACKVVEVSTTAFDDWRRRVAAGPTDAERAEAELVGALEHSNVPERHRRPSWTAGQKATSPPAAVPLLVDPGWSHHWRKGGPMLLAELTWQWSQATGGRH